MKVLAEVTEHAMIAAFLRAEIESPRFQQNIFWPLDRDGQSRSIVDNPNLEDNTENTYRTALLGSARGYRNSFLFEGFPNTVQWYSASMTHTDLAGVRVMRNDSWPVFAGISRLAGDAAQHIKTGKITPELTKDILSTKDHLEQGRTLPEIIIVGEGFDKDLIILEGHVRTMALLVSDTNKEVHVLIGISSDMRNWVYY